MTRKTAQEHGDDHLRTTQEVTGYKVFAVDGHIGHIDDFIVDESTWKIRYLAVDTRDWWLGKKVLLPPDWLGQVSWLDKKVTVDVSRDQVRNASEWDFSETIDRAFEEWLYNYYIRQTPWEQERVHELAS